MYHFNSFNKVKLSFLFSFTGASLGLFLTYLNPIKFTAISIIEVGSIVTPTGIRPVDDTIMIDNFLTRPETANKIAEKTSKLSDGILYKSLKYGGFNYLTIREFPKFPYIQIRVRSVDQETALKVVGLASDLLIAHQNEKINEWVSYWEYQFKINEINIEERIKNAEKNANDRAMYAEDSFAKQVSEIELNEKQNNSNIDELASTICKDCFAKTDDMQLKTLYVTKNNIVENAILNLRLKNADLETRRVMSSLDKSKTIFSIKDSVEAKKIELLDSLNLQKINLKDVISRQEMYKPKISFDPMIEMSLFGSPLIMSIVGSVIGFLFWFFCMLLVRSPPHIKNP
jgi:hypothetical protein